MVFSSLVFIFVFLPLTLALYYLAPKPYRNLILFGASLIFYAWGEPVYISIMIFSTVFDYLSALVIEKHRNSTKTAMTVLIVSITINLGILCFFKYYDFVINNINSVFNMNLSLLNLPLPVGISFYTFQAVSYIIDVYLEKVPAQKGFISFGAYLTMFPQLVAGPIVRYSDIETQLKSRSESLDLFGEGAEKFINGLVKKVLIANNIGFLWSGVKSTAMGELTVLSAWLGITAFTFQIYFDFSGYSDMAVGLGKMFGFDFMKNFDYPYISMSVSEFWRRWHISLGSWFREYVYIPLGGNRHGKRKQYCNLLIVWFLTGLWHGANWNFIIWGLYFGFFIILENAFLGEKLKKWPAFAHIYTLLIVMLGWVFFEWEDLGQCILFLKTMFGLTGAKLFDARFLYCLYTNLLLLIVSAAACTPVLRNFIDSMKKNHKSAACVIMPIVYLSFMLLCTAYLVNESYNPFLYFRF